MVTRARMLGKSFGPSCNCCGDTPGKYRVISRRTAKRSERNKWKRETLAL